MKYVVVTDFSFLWHMVYWPAVKAVKSDPKYILEEVIQTNLNGKMRTLERDLRELQVDEYDLIFVEDRMPRHKIELFPAYHHDRPDNSEKKTELKHYAQGNGFNCKFVHSEGNEADDAIATVANLALSQPDNFVIVCTGDHDLWQLTGDRIVIFDLLKRHMITKFHVYDKFKVHAQQIALVKSLWGDPSDNVPNVMPFQQKQMMPIVKKTTDGSLEYFKYHVEREWNTLSKKCQQLYSEGLGQISINYELVRLSNNCELSWG